MAKAASKKDSKQSENPKQNKASKQSKDSKQSIASAKDKTYVNQDGQYALFPEIPERVIKARGPVIDSVMTQVLDEEATSLVVDDTYEIPEKPIPIQTRVFLSYENVDFDIKGRVKLTAFDREVIDAVASLAQINEIITPAMIYRVMMGKREYQYVSPRQQDLVRKSMEKCGYSMLKIDLTDMYEKDSPVGRQLKKKGVTATFSGNLLAFEMVTLSKNGKRVDCYKILTEPALFRYAASLGKISEYPIELMDTRVSKTERNIVIQSFLLRNIDEMYRGERKCLIEMSEFYGCIGAQDDSPQHKARYRTTAIAILDDWEGKGFISGHTIRKAGREIRGFNIILNQNQESTAGANAP